MSLRPKADDALKSSLYDFKYDPSSRDRHIYRNKDIPDINNISFSELERVFVKKTNLPYLFYVSPLFFTSRPSFFTSRAPRFSCRYIYDRHRKLGEISNPRYRLYYTYGTGTGCKNDLAGSFQQIFRISPGTTKRTRFSIYISSLSISCNLYLYLHLYLYLYLYLYSRDC